MRHRLDGLDCERAAVVRNRLAERIADRQRDDGYYLEATALLATGTQADD